MKVKYHSMFGSEVVTAVSELPSVSCTDAEGYYSGPSERVSERQSRLEEIVGAMLERMARDGRLSAGEVLELAGIRPVAGRLAEYVEDGR